MSRPWKVPLNNKSLPSTVESAPNVTFDKIPSSRQSPRWYKMSRRFKSNYWKYKTEQNKPVDCSTERAERDAVTLRGCFTPCQSNVCQFILWICFHQTFCSLTLINKNHLRTVVTSPPGGSATSLQLVSHTCMKFTRMFHITCRICCRNAALSRPFCVC